MPSWNIEALKSCEDVGQVFPPAFSIWEICKVHSMVVGDVGLSGRFRRFEETAIVGGVRQGVPACYIHQELVNLQLWLRAMLPPCGNVPVLDVVANFSYRFGTIHPFADGNGRCCAVLACIVISRRLGLNFERLVAEWGGSYEAYTEAIAADHFCSTLPQTGAFLHGICARSGSPQPESDTLLSHQASCWLWFDQEFSHITEKRS